MGEIGVQRPDITVNRHVVVVEDDEKIGIGIGGVVESLESQTSAYRSVTYDGNDIARGLVLVESGRHSHA